MSEFSFELNDLTFNELLPEERKKAFIDRVAKRIQENKEAPKDEEGGS